MELNDIIDQYRTLTQMGGFSPTKEDTQKAQDFLAEHASKIDFIFENPDDIFRLVGIVVERGTLTSFKDLLDAGLDVNLTNAKFETILTSSKTYYLRNLDFLKLAIDSGANLNIRTASNKGFLELFLAECRENLLREAIDYILALPQFSQELNQPQSDGKHLFHIAVHRGFVDIAAKILDKGYNINTFYTYQTIRKENITQNALHLACQRFEQNMASMLIEKGIDINAKDSNGKTAIDFVLEEAFYVGHKRDAILKTRIALLDLLDSSGILNIYKTKAFFGMLQELDRSPNGSRFCADMANRLMSYGGVDLNHVTDSGNTVLHLAASSGHFDIFKVAAKAGSDINAKNNKGDTPIMLAATKKHDQIVMTLIRLGADTNATNLQGVSLLDILTKNGNAPMIELMLSK